MTTTVVDVPGASRYELRLDGELAGHVGYRVDGESLVLVHTEVDPAFEGKGLGGTLAAGVLDDLRRQGRTAKLECPYLAKWVARHPDHQDVVAS